MADSKRSCDRCAHFQHSVFGMAVYCGRFQGIEIEGHHYDAIGVGICQHPERPRGLVPALDISCRDWFSAKLLTGGPVSMKDVTPPAPLIEDLSDG